MSTLIREQSFITGVSGETENLECYEADIIQHSNECEINFDTPFPGPENMHNFRHFT